MNGACKIEPTATIREKNGEEIFPNDTIIDIAKIQVHLADKLEGAEWKTPISFALWHLKMASESLLMVF